MKKKNYKLLTKLFMDKLIPQNKKKIMPSFSQAVNIEDFFNKIKRSLSKKKFEKYLDILDRFQLNQKIDNYSNNLPNPLSNDILIEYYCSKKVIKCLKVISEKN